MLDVDGFSDWYHLYVEREELKTEIEKKVKKQIEEVFGKCVLSEGSDELDRAYKIFLA